MGNGNFPIIRAYNGNLYFLGGAGQPQQLGYTSGMINYSSPLMQGMSPQQFNPSGQVVSGQTIQQSVSGGIPTAAQGQTRTGPSLSNIASSSAPLLGLGAGLVNQIVDDPTSRGGAIASGMMSGAASGAALGPIGMGAGAVIGGVTGLLGANKAAKEQGLMENRQAREAYATGTAGMSPYAHVYANGGLTEFNEGGRHEENRLGGIPQGINKSNGEQNLVEEGETKHDDYIFSDRLKLENPNEYNLGGKLAGKTFADISKSLSKIVSERPNDPISKKGQELSLNRLKMANDDAIAMKEFKQSNPPSISGGRTSYKYGGFIFTDY